MFILIIHYFIFVIISLKIKKNSEKNKNLQKHIFQKKMEGGELEPMVSLISVYDDQVSYCSFWRVTFLKYGKNGKSLEKLHLFF